jgi:hypothetical protein
MQGLSLIMSPPDPGTHIVFGSCGFLRLLVLLLLSPPRPVSLLNAISWKPLIRFFCNCTRLYTSTRWIKWQLYFYLGRISQGQMTILCVNVVPAVSQEALDQLLRNLKWVLLPTWPGTKQILVDPLQGQILRVTFYAFSFLIVSNTYKLRAIVGWIKLHLFPQIFTMADFHAQIQNGRLSRPKFLFYSSILVNYGTAVEF